MSAACAPASNPTVVISVSGLVDEDQEYYLDAWNSESPFDVTLFQSILERMGFSSDEVQCVECEETQFTVTFKTADDLISLCETDGLCVVSSAEMVAELLHRAELQPNGPGNVFEATVPQPLRTPVRGATVLTRLQRCPIGAYLLTPSQSHRPARLVLTRRPSLALSNAQLIQQLSDSFRQPVFTVTASRRPAVSTLGANATLDGIARSDAVGLLTPSAALPGPATSALSSSSSFIAASSGTEDLESQLNSVLDIVKQLAERTPPNQTQLVDFLQPVTAQLQRLVQSDQQQQKEQRSRKYRAAKLADMVLRICGLVELLLQVFNVFGGDTDVLKAQMQAAWTSVNTAVKSQCHIQETESFDDKKRTIDSYFTQLLHFVTQLLRTLQLAVKDVAGKSLTSINSLIRQLASSEPNHDELQDQEDLPSAPAS